MKLEGAFNHDFLVKEVMNPVVTFRREFVFAHQDINYLIKVDHSVYPLLRALQDKY